MNNKINKIKEKISKSLEPVMSKEITPKNEKIIKETVIRILATENLKYDNIKYDNINVRCNKNGSIEISVNMTLNI